jgi:hypothetical protein
MHCHRAPCGRGGDGEKRREAHQRDDYRLYH